LENGATQQKASCAGRQRRIVIDYGVWQIRHAEAKTEYNNYCDQGCKLSAAEQFRLKLGGVDIRGRRPRPGSQTDEKYQ
jgi:hypothetical protein